MVEVEIRIKNEGASLTTVERDLSVDGGNVIMYIVHPNGKIRVKINN